jgi:hypothetical protein
MVDLISPGVATSALLLVLIATGVAQDRHAAQAVLDRYVDAVGGATAIQAIHSRITVYDMDLGRRIHGQLEVRQQLPDRVIERGTARGWGWHGTFDKGFDGAVGWAKAPDGQRHPLQGVALHAYALRSRLDRDAHLGDLYPTRVALPDRTLDGRRYQAVDLTTTFGTHEVWSFDSATGLLTQTDVPRTGDSASAAAPETTTFDDYRMVDGVRVPFHLTVRDGKRGYALTVKTITNNATLSRDDFAVPKTEAR